MGPKVPGPGLSPAAVKGFVTTPYALYDECKRRYGDVFRITVPGFGSMVHVNRPAHVEIAHRLAGDDVRRGTGSLMEPVFGPNSIVVLDGDRHKRRRQLIGPCFRGLRLTAYAHTIFDTARRHARRWEDQPTLPLLPRLAEITHEEMIRLVFGLDDEETIRTLHEAIAQSAKRFRGRFLFIKALQQDWGPLTAWGRWLRTKEAVDAIVYPLIERTRAGLRDESSDILSILLRARRDDGTGLSDAEAHDEVLTLLATGHENSANVVSWCLLLLEQHPAVKARLREELDGCDDDPDQALQLPYLDAVVKEVMRWVPPPEHYRRLAKPLQLDEYTLDAPDVLAPNIYLAARREDTWGDPDVFRPERFLDGTFGGRQYFPFGGGMRKCIADAFGHYGVKMTLYALCKGWDFALHDPTRETPRRQRLSVVPAQGLRGSVRARA